MSSYTPRPLVEASQAEAEAGTASNVAITPRRWVQALAKLFAPFAHALTGKATPVDADEVVLIDSAASNVAKKLTWANLKTTIKASLVKGDVGLGNVTNDVQTKASVVPNTAPTSGQILVGNATGGNYSPRSMSGDATLSNTGVLTLASSGAVAGSYVNSDVTVDAKGRVTAISNGSPTSTPFQVDVFDGNLLFDDQVVTTTWEVPSGARVIEVILIGGGGSGGSGRRGASGTVRCGGGGGAAGAYAHFYLDESAALPGYIWDIKYGGRVTGGAGQTADNTNGNPGKNGCDAVFAYGSYITNGWIAKGGAGGAGGTNATPSAGGAALTNGNLEVSVPFNTSAGGNGGAGTVDATPGGSVYGMCPTGGGGGSGSGSSNPPGDAGAGGSLAGALIYGGGSKNNPGVSFNIIGTGGGGGDGGSNAGGAALSGGDGGLYGGGGGGGGGSLNGVTSGAGGKGGPSYIIIRSYF